MRGDAWVQDKGLKIPYATTYTWNLKKKKKKMVLKNLGSGQE